ncbi:MAG TPA: hypothetical protein VIJ70_08785 [Gaiellaceae bacterium]
MRLSQAVGVALIVCAAAGAADRTTTLLGSTTRKAPLWTIAAAVGHTPTTLGRYAIQEAVW